MDVKRAGPDVCEEEKEERRFWFYPILVRRQRRGEFHGLIPELKLSYISQHVSVAILPLLGQHLTTQKSFRRAD